MIYLYEYLAHAALLEASDNIANLYMRRELPVMLRQEYGENWMNDFVHPIMRHYEYYGNQTFPEEAPLSTLDLSAMWFLLFPYEKTGNGNINHFNGAGEIVKTIKGLDDRQYRNLRAVRTLRNSFEHNDPSIQFVKPEHKNNFHEELRLMTQKDGTQKEKMILVYDIDDAFEGQLIIHTDAIDFLTRAIQPLDSKVLTLSQNEKQKIIEKLKEQISLHQDVYGETDIEKKLRMQKYRETIEESRSFYTGKAAYYEWVREPVGEPLQTPVPWAQLNIDLDTLPWPSAKREKEMKERTEKALKNNKDKSDNSIFSAAHSLLRLFKEDPNKQ